MSATKKKSTFPGVFNPNFAAHHRQGLIGHGGRKHGSPVRLRGATQFAKGSAGTIWLDPNPTINLRHAVAVLEMEKQKGRRGVPGSRWQSRLRSSVAVSVRKGGGKRGQKFKVFTTAAAKNALALPFRGAIRSPGGRACNFTARQPQKRRSREAADYGGRAFTSKIVSTRSKNSFDSFWLGGPPAHA